MSGESAQKKTFVYQSVFVDIVRKEYTNTSIITEKQLIEKYGISKSPVREALLQLCADDILISLPRIGYMLKSVSLKDINDALVLRKMIELKALEISFPEIKEEQIRTLKALYNESKEVAETKDVYRNWELNTRFHMTLCMFSRNRFFTRTLNNLLRTCFRSVTSYYEDSWESEKKQSEWHLELISALTDNDFEKARYALFEDLSDLDDFFLIKDSNNSELKSAFIVQ